MKIVKNALSAFFSKCLSCYFVICIKTYWSIVFLVLAVAPVVLATVLTTPYPGLVHLPLRLELGLLVKARPLFLLRLLRIPRLSPQPRLNEVPC